MIYQAGGYQDAVDIKTTWQNLLDHTHTEVSRRGEPLPYEAIVEKIRTLGPRLSLSETLFPINDLVPMLKRYAFEFQRHVGLETWVVDVLVEINVPFESLFAVLEAMYYGDEAPFQGPNRRYISNDLIYVAQLWYQQTSRGNWQILGNEENAAEVSQMLQLLVSELEPSRAEECQILRARIEHSLR